MGDPPEGLPKGTTSDPCGQHHHHQGAEEDQHGQDAGDQDYDDGLGSHGFPGFYPNTESYPIPPVIPYLVMDPRGGMTNLFSWAHLVADLTNGVDSRLANMESEVQQNAYLLGAKLWISKQSFTHDYRCLGKPNRDASGCRHISAELGTFGARF